MAAVSLYGGCMMNGLVEPSPALVELSLVGEEHQSVRCDGGLLLESMKSTGGVRFFKAACKSVVG